MSQSAPSAPFFCDHCGAANRSQASFCAVCGQPLRSPAATITIHSTISTSSTSSTLVQQTLLKQRYVIIKQIGKGGFGAVYQAEDTHFGNRTVAVKEMSQNGLKPEDIVSASEDFRREAHLLAGLIHPNLPRIYEHFTDTGRSYLVMDYIDGQALDEQLAQRYGKLLSIDKVLEIGIQLSDVLDYLHTRQPPIIFRDLKPANVMMTASGHLYLIDFGIARHFKPGKAKDTSALGSSGYAAPEQYGKAQTTPQTDIYGLGATLHQLLTGHDPSDTPFHFMPISLDNQPALAGLDTLIMSMVAIKVEERPASAALVKQQLQQFMTRLTVHRTHQLPYGIPNAYQTLPTRQPGQAGLPAQRPPASNLPSLPMKVSAPKVARSSRINPQQIRPQSNTLYMCIGHTSRITSVVWSPNGKYIASGSFDKTTHLWDANNGQNIRAHKAHMQRIQALAWSPDSTRIASASDDATVQIWDISTGNTLYTYSGHRGEVNALAWSPDGTRIASTSTDCTVHVWDAKSGTVYNTYHHAQSVNAVTWSPDSRRIASAGKDGWLHIWEASKEQQKRSLFTSLFSHRGPLKINGLAGEINALSWSLDGHYVAAACHEHTIKAWYAENGRMAFFYGPPSGIINAVAWSPNSKFIASAGNDKHVTIWNTVSKRTAHTYFGHTGYVMAVAWSPDGTRLASAGVDRTVQVWQAV